MVAMIAIPLSRRGAALCAAAGLLVALTGCSGSQGPANTGLTPAASSLGYAHASVPDAKGKMLYVADRGGAIYGYPAAGTGNVAPAVTITGPNTGLQDPVAFAVDSTGKLYAANDSAQSVLMFPAGSNGDVTPAVLGGSNIPLMAVEGVAVDSGGLIYVSDYLGVQVLVFAAGATGNTAPIRTIAGSKTGLTQPTGMAFDSKGDLYVANYSESGVAIVEFPPGANGNVAPIGTIGIAGGGGKSTLYQAFNVQIGANDEIVVPNGVDESIDVFKDGAKGNVKPNRVLTGANTGLSDITSIGLDSKGFLYVTNFAASSGAQIAVFRPGAKGNTKPLRVLQGAATGLDDPFYPSF